MCSSLLTCAAGMSEYPLFLQPSWFLPSNASALRGRIRALCLNYFVDQVSPSPVPAATAADATPEMAPSASVCLSTRSAPQRSMRSILQAHNHRRPGYRQVHIWLIVPSCW